MQGPQDAHNSGAGAHERETHWDRATRRRHHGHSRHGQASSAREVKLSHTRSDRIEPWSLQVLQLGGTLALNDRAKGYPPRRSTEVCEPAEGRTVV